MSSNAFDLPNLGLGLGLRSKHFNHILTNKPKVDWFEIISENFMDSGGKPRYILDQIAEQYPIVMHGVSMSIGSTDPLNFKYLHNLKQLIQDVNPVWVSDHLCWTGVLSINSHDLLPLPLNEETLRHVCNRINLVQDFLERPLILENPSTYMKFKHSTMNEWEFLSLMTEETGCGLLLDVNNVYVSSFNNEFNPIEYLKHIPYDKVVQMHLAGHQHCGDYIIDTHDRQVADYVWELFRFAWQQTQGVSTLLEWDGAIPSFDIYHQELLRAKEFMSGSFNPQVVEHPILSQEQAISTPLDYSAPEINI